MIHGMPLSMQSPIGSSATGSKAAREVFGRRLTAAEVRAYARGIEAMADTVALLERYLDRAGETEPATVHRIQEAGDGDER